MKLDLDLLDFGACVARIDGGILSCNAAFKDVMRLSSSNGRDLSHLSVFDLLGLSLSKEKSLPLRETIALPGNGGNNKRWVDCRIKHMDLLSAGGEVLGGDESGEGVLVQVHDVTKSMLRYEQSMFILETSFDGFWDWNMVSNYEYMSPQFWKMFGYDPATKRHSPDEWKDIIYEEDKTRAVEAMEKHVESRGEYPYNLTVRYKHREGGTVTVICKGRVVEWAEDGSPLRMIGTHTDITELRQREEREEALKQHLKQQEKRIEQSESNLVSFITSVESPVLAVDPSARISRWNPFMQKITGYSAASVIGKPLREFSPEDLPAEFLSLLSDPASKTDVGIQLALRTKDGATVTLLLTSSGVTDSRQGVTNVLFLGQDVSSLLASKAREIEAAASAEKRIVEYLAHEIRNPLFACKTACQLIIESLKDTTEAYSRKKQLDDMEIVDSSLIYIVELLSSVLLIGKLLAGDVEFALRPVNVLRDILKPVADIVRLRSRSISVYVECQPDLLVMLDPIRTKQIVVNLAFNSVKFTPRGHIRLGAAVRKEGGKEVLQLVTEDTGIGIPEDKKSMVFLKYVSLDQETQGNGIGLYLCQRIVELMGGKIFLDEGYNSGLPNLPGCRFVVNLPFEPADFSSASCVALHEEQVNKVLKVQAVVADDDPINRKLVKRRILKAHPSWVVHEVKNGEECISLVIEDKVPVDAIILDQYMASGKGSLTGAEATKELRERGYMGVIIGFSGNDCKNDFIAAGADGFWRKPAFDFDVLLAGLDKRRRTVSTA